MENDGDNNGRHTFNTYHGQEINCESICTISLSVGLLSGGCRYRLVRGTRTVGSNVILNPTFKLFRCPVVFVLSRSAHRSIPIAVSCVWGNQIRNFMWLILVIGSPALVNQRQLVVQQRWGQTTEETGQTQARTNSIRKGQLSS